MGLLVYNTELALEWNERFELRTLHLAPNHCSSSKRTLLGNFGRSLCPIQIDLEGRCCRSWCPVRLFSERPLISLVKACNLRYDAWLFWNYKEFGRKTSWFHVQMMMVDYFLLLKFWQRLRESRNSHSNSSKCFHGISLLLFRCQFWLELALHWRLLVNKLAATFIFIEGDWLWFWETRFVCVQILKPFFQCFWYFDIMAFNFSLKPKGKRRMMNS